MTHRKLNKDRRCACFILSAGKGSRMGQLTKKKPKHLLALMDKRALESTVLGRLVHQFQNQPSVHRIVIISGHFHEPFTDWVVQQESLLNLKVSVQVIRRGREQHKDWEVHHARLINSHLSKSENALIMTGDTVACEQDIRRAVTKARESQRPFSHLYIGRSVRPGGMPRFGLLCWLTEKETLERALQDSQQSFPKMFDLSLNMGRNNTTMGGQFVNLNTQEDLYFAKDLIRKDERYY